jgi:hypothetical protein
MKISKQVQWRQQVGTITQASDRDSVNNCRKVCRGGLTARRAKHSHTRPSRIELASIARLSRRLTADDWEGRRERPAARALMDRGAPRLTPVPSQREAHFGAVAGPVSRMSAMVDYRQRTKKVIASCVYCPHPPDGEEHWLNRSLGRFAGNSKLTGRICTRCNVHFGGTIDLELARTAHTGVLRQVLGIEGRSTHVVSGNCIHAGLS